jgi:queuine tRNA-ribosyltransferase
VIETPGFVPVATSGALKGVTNEQADAAGVQLMFANTYHLVVHPGADVVAGAGGLHSYMGRTRPLITDSGGFQVFSLGGAAASDGSELKRRNKRGGAGGLLLSTREQGVVFRSYFDSSPIELTPESSVRARR